jgi:hypothetical protein
VRANLEAVLEGIDGAVFLGSLKVVDVLPLF